MGLLPFERVDTRINAKIFFKNFKMNFAIGIFTQRALFFKKISTVSNFTLELFFFFEVA